MVFSLPNKKSVLFFIFTRATVVAESGFVSHHFCVPKIAPTCFADDFDVYMACDLISFLFDRLSRSESDVACLL